MANASPPITAECPECSAGISFNRPPLNGQIATCRECGIELEVTSISPLTLEAAPEVEEDWGE